MHRSTQEPGKLVETTRHSLGSVFFAILPLFLEILVTNRARNGGMAACLHQGGSSLPVPTPAGTSTGRTIGLSPLDDSPFQRASL
jgi:hypothetical protein